MEVLVVDTASADGSGEMIETKFSWVKLIKSPENLRFSYCNNLAIRQAQGRYIPLFNSDGLLDEDLFMYGDDVDWWRLERNVGWDVVFYPGAQAIHDPGKTTAPYPVRFAVAQQRSVIHYWSKHHGFVGVMGIRSIIFFHHLLRYSLAVASGFLHPKRRSEGEVRKQVSGACLRALISGTLPHGA